MEFLRKHIPAYILRYIRYTGFALLIFGIYRLLLFGLEYERAGDASPGLIAQSFVMGLRFDLVITCYILLFPFFLSTLHNFGLRTLLLRLLARLVLYAGFAGAFIVSAVDIPYFRQFFERLTVAVFSWKENAVFMFKMVAQEPRYVLFIIPLLLILVSLYRFGRRNDSALFQKNTTRIIPSLFISILCLGFIVLGIRGRIEKKSPIRIGTAYFSNNAFLNKLGLNPSFTLIRTYLDELEAEDAPPLRDPGSSRAFVMETLGSNDQLMRLIESTQSRDLNVILVLMEGMSADKMTRHGNNKGLTPYLDSLSYQGHYFENAYSTGIHTFNGVYSSLFGMPSYYRRHPMKGIPKRHKSGLFRSLKEQGYSTMYFTTHDGQFDNIEGFLMANDCEQVISAKNYPSDAIISALGVPDDYMFQFAIPYLDEKAGLGKPFVATLMTASDHGPYIIPEGFECRNPNAMDCIVEYADDAIRHFMESIKDKAWYDSTLFVFVADHGAPLSSTYPISLSYTHVPLLFYAPALIDSAQSSTAMASQMDIFPSIMSLLGRSYTDWSLGHDLFSQEASNSVFTYDDKLGVIDQEWFYCEQPDGISALYHYRSKDKKDYSDSLPTLKQHMERYGKSFLQTYKDLQAKP